jgi:hypothetical protein
MTANTALAFTETKELRPRRLEPFEQLRQARKICMSHSPEGL